MNIFAYTPEQLDLLQMPLDSKVFLEGPAGAGKTTAAVGRVLRLLENGVRGDSVLLLAPQRSLAQPYDEALRAPGVGPGGVVDVLTVGGLARRNVDLFWPLVAERAGFAHPDALPTFLTLETAQYYMAHLVRPLLEEGLFDSLAIDRNRLYSQLLDNLNKAAVMGFPSAEIGERLSSAWVGEPGQLRVYQDVQTCVNLFRRYCLAHNLLDFSLQMEVFIKHVWMLPEVRSYLDDRYRHLIFENLEEDTPVAHDLIGEWLPSFESALLVCDWGGGYRSFLGADPQGASNLREQCERREIFNDSLVMSRPLMDLESQLVAAFGGAAGIQGERQAPIDEDQDSRSGEHPPALNYAYHRFYPEMLDWVANSIAELVFDGGVPAGQIVVLAPFLSDSLRFSLSNRLEKLDIPWRSFRPSRSLRDEPATRCLTTISALAYPEWGLAPSQLDISHTLVQAIAEMDLVRAQLLTRIVYRQRAGQFELTSFDEIQPSMQERITFRLGERYEVLRRWLAAIREGDETSETEDSFDHFLGRLFGEVLSQPGFGFHGDFDAGRVTANLIESVQKFRWVANETLQEENIPLGQEYLAMLADGVIAAQYLQGWRTDQEDAVLLAPAYTFLMSNRPVEIQFWLDAGARGWSERLYQPLTHPYVLSRDWPAGRIWTDSDEVETERAMLHRLASGLLHRCRGAIYLGLSELGEAGYEQRGPLLQAFQHVLRVMNRS